MKNSRHRDFSNQRIWITGASSGIGRACALEFSRRGAKVALSGRNREALSELAEACGGLAIPFDVCDTPEHARAAQTIQEAWGGLDIAFFNAGTSLGQRFSAAEYEAVMRVNYVGLIYGIEAALPLLRTSENPQLVGMASIAGFLGMPQLAGYCATKAAVRSLLQGLRHDAETRGIEISIVCPGFIRTPMTDRHDFSMPFLMEPEAAAKKIVDGVAKKRRGISFPFAMAFPLKALASLPEAWTSRLMPLIAPTHPRQRRVDAVSSPNVGL